ncbi:uncharacterized protein LOC119113469 [Pollicipes pollicipes]|uniref:uncharacterized protein LOC119113469 n=1 Tax=Pollicipes pollicipes TaxID=41117 RepID=UPI0018849A92|nr:uncharacterized protein LOC119113469 [Pollicipes pollicipes]
MEGHSRAGDYRDGSGDSDFFDRMKNNWGREADMFFDQDARAPGWGTGFSRGGMSMGPDPEMEEMRGRARPKFRSFDALRPGVFAPRPFQRERRTSGEPAWTPSLARRARSKYIFLDEMLTRELIKLDDVETGGDDEVRTSRKDVIMSIQNCLGRLERQSSVAAAEQTAGEQPSETEQLPTG